MKKAKPEKKNVQIKKDTLKKLTTEDLESGSVVGATECAGCVFND